MRSKKQKIKNLINILLMISINILVCGNAFAATHYVSPTGTNTWANSTNIASPCSLATALSNVVAGDLVYLRGGTYSYGIILNAKSGTAVNKITFKACTGETPVIENTANALWSGRYHGLLLYKSNYIKIEGIKFNRVSGDYLLQIVYGSSYNEISNCTFNGNGGGVINIWKGSSGFDDSYATIHNWIHDSVIGNNMSLYTSDGAVYNNMGMQVGMYTYDYASGHNTIENNTFYCNGHHNIETFTKNNVIRNNFISNASCRTNTTGGIPAYTPDSNGKYGHRNIQIYDGNSSDGVFNLIEGNRFGPSGAPPENDGGDGFTLTAPKNILRYNEIYNAQNNGILLKTGAGSYADNNKIYNNTIVYSGRYKNGPQWQGWNFRWYGSYARTGNSVINNIIYGYGAGGADWGGGSATTYTENTVTNNWCTTAISGVCVGNGNPFFTSTILPGVSDEQTTSSPDLTLQSSSPVIDQGTYLTKANGSGGSSKILIVNDAMYFQDGSWGSALTRTAGTMQADWIAIGSVNNIVQISSIDYSTNTITLASPMTWTSGAAIWLFRSSNGSQVLYGSAPDIGAHEYGSENPQEPAPTTSVPPTVSVTPTTKDFGTLPINTSSPAQRFTVTTTGGNLNVDAISVTGIDATQFTIQNDTCTGKIIAPEAGSCTFDVKFSPSSVGAKAANVAIVDNDSNTSKLIAVNGTGTSQIPAISFSPTSLSFSNVLSGTLSSPQTINVSNNSANFVTISSVSLSGTDANQFSIPAATDYCTGETVAASGNCSFQVIFAPTSGGEKTANVNLTALYYSNPATLPLYGSAVVYQSPVPRIKISKKK